MEQKAVFSGNDENEKVLSSYKKPYASAAGVSTLLRTAALTAVLSGMLAGCAAVPLETKAVVRVNLAGASPGDTIRIIVMSKADISGRQVELIEDGTGIPAAVRVASGITALERIWGDWPFLYTASVALPRVSDLHGIFRVRVAGAPEIPSGSSGDAALANGVSLPFPISDSPYETLPELSLSFFHMQRCGPDQVSDLRSPCHLLDGLYAGAPSNPTRPLYATGSLPAAGGWHDAGDYIKFMSTTGYSLALLAHTVDRLPSRFGLGETAPAGGPLTLPQDHPAQTSLAEIRHGTAWMHSMWDKDAGMLYYQVADARDHDSWRLPEVDTDPALRGVSACEPGKGANIAGKTAANLALGALLAARYTGWVATSEAADWATAAEEIFAWGMERQSPQSSNPPEFYSERTWKDDMALAAVRLWRLTGNQGYREQAEAYLSTIGAGLALNWSDVSALAQYELALAYPAWKPKAAAALETGLRAASALSEHDKLWGLAIGETFWGCLEDITSLTLKSAWYADLTGDLRYRAMAERQRDYIFGLNPWGLSFVAGFGAKYPKQPHHQISAILGTDLVGFWDEGPIPRTEWENLGIVLESPDVYAAFQDVSAEYHDDYGDYATNEPTISMNATGFAASAWW